jgi:hypothetical protein
MTRQPWWVQASSGRAIGPLQRPLPETHNTHKRRTFMPLAGLEPANPASERPQTYVLDRAATRTGSVIMSYYDAALSSFEYCRMMG